MIIRLLGILIALTLLNASLVSAQPSYSNVRQLVEDENKVTNLGAELSTKKPLTFKSDAVIPPSGSVAMYLVLLFVLMALIVLLVYAKQRITGQTKGSLNGVIEVVDRKRIGVNTWTTLIKANRAEYLIVENNHGVAVQVVNASVNNAPESISKEYLE